MSDQDQKEIPENTSIGEVQLASTVDSFAQRMKRRFKEQEDREALEQKEAALRHRRIFQAMNTSRKALQESLKIDLGSKLSLELDVSDIEGWPKIELALVHEDYPENRDLALLILSDDLKALGTITFHLRSGDLVGKIHLRSDRELEKLPLLLKKSLRDFLDTVSTYVFEELPRKEEQETKIVFAEETSVDELQSELNDKNLFMDEEFKDDRNLVSQDDSMVPVELDPF